VRGALDFAEFKRVEYVGEVKDFEDHENFVGVWGAPVGPEGEWLEG
jgi:hypothetical protein